MSERTKVNSAFEYGERLRAFREAANMTQEELAILTGLSTHTIGNAENLNRASIDTLVKMVSALGHNLNDIIPIKTAPKEIAIIRADDENMRLEFDKKRDYYESKRILKKYLDNSEFI